MKITVNEEWVARATGNSFREWVEREHSGSEGPFCREEMEAAYRAGYHQRETED